MCHSELREIIENCIQGFEAQHQEEQVQVYYTCTLNMKYGFCMRTLAPAFCIERWVNEDLLRDDTAVDSIIYIFEKMYKELMKTCKENRIILIGEE